MEILRGDDGKFRILHAGKIVKGLTYLDEEKLAGPFDTEVEANGWADMWVDDQVFDSQNDFSPELEYALSTPTTQP